MSESKKQANRRRWAMKRRSTDELQRAARSFLNNSPKRQLVCRLRTACDLWLTVRAAEIAKAQEATK